MIINIFNTHVYGGERKAVPEVGVGHKSGT